MPVDAGIALGPPVETKSHSNSNGCADRYACTDAVYSCTQPCTDGESDAKGKGPQVAGHTRFGLVIALGAMTQRSWTQAAAPLHTGCPSPGRDDRAPTPRSVWSLRVPRAR